MVTRVMVYNSFGWTQHCGSATKHCIMNMQLHLQGTILGTSISRFHLLNVCVARVTRSSGLACWGFGPAACNLLDFESHASRKRSSPSPGTPSLSSSGAFFRVLYP